MNLEAGAASRLAFFARLNRPMRPHSRTVSLFQAIHVSSSSRTPSPQVGSMAEQFAITEAHVDDCWLLGQRPQSGACHGPVIKSSVRCERSEGDFSQLHDLRCRQHRSTLKDEFSSRVGSKGTISGGSIRWESCHGTVDVQHVRGAAERPGQSQRSVILNVNSVMVCMALSSD